MMRRFLMLGLIALAIGAASVPVTVSRSAATVILADGNDYDQGGG